MALIGSREQEKSKRASARHVPLPPPGPVERSRRPTSPAQRVASRAFLIRVGAAALAFGSQVLLARWMGAHEFGIYVYVSTWVMVIAGGVVDIGIASSAQRFIPQYSEKGASAAAARLPVGGGRWLVGLDRNHNRRSLVSPRSIRCAAGSTITRSSRSPSAASFCRSTA